jgi:pimeloyl-ACP methyl ester carboxylesterase
VRRRTGTLDHSGEELYFEVVGGGAVGDAREPVVLCHGLGGNHASWWQQLGPLVDAGFTAVTWDQRGFGNSTRRTGVAGPEPAVGDLVALVDHLGLGAVHVVGQSMGGWVAMGVALHSEVDLVSLTLTDTLAGVYTDDVLAALSQSSGARPQLSADELGQHPALGPRFRAEQPERAALYQLLSGFGDKPPEDEMMTALATMRVDPTDVAALSVPVHLLVGEDDHLCPPEAMAVMAGIIPDAELTVIPGSGHSPYFEDPVAFNRAVIGFLDRHRSSKA